MLSLLVSILSGLLLSLAFPRGNIWPLAWIAPVPLMYLVYSKSWRRAAGCGFAFGLGFFGSLIYWISLFGWLPWVLLVIYQALFFAGFAVAARTLGRRRQLWSRLLVLPSSWVLFEWLRGLGPVGFTWGNLGYSQYLFLPAVQPAAAAGVMGVSFLVAFSAAGLANALAAWRLKLRPSACALHAGLPIALTALLVLLSGIPAREAGEGGRVLKAAVIQGNVKQDTESIVELASATWAVYERRTAEAAKLGADLVLWPESAVPGPVDRDLYLRERLERNSRDLNILLLTGAWGDAPAGYRNSAYLFDPARGLAGEYSKVHLVPFGEYVLLRRYLPFLERYRVRREDAVPGKSFRTMDAGGIRAGTAICFESAFPYILRKMTLEGANLLCVITDDEWFSNSPAAEQHMSKSVFRAVENRRWVLRSAATGISCLVDPRGRVVRRAELWTEGTLSGQISLLEARTFYTLHGDWIVLFCGVLLLASAFIGRLRARSG